MYDGMKYCNMHFIVYKRKSVVVLELESNIVQADWWQFKFVHVCMYNCHGVISHNTA